MKIENVYRPAVETCSLSDPLRDAARPITEADTGSLAVVAYGALVSIISERDVVRAVADGADPRRLPVVGPHGEVTRMVPTRDLFAVETPA
jgi:CBS domain-containing protein